MDVATVIVPCVVAVLGSGAFSSVVTLWLNRYYSKQDKDSAETKATMYNLLTNLQNEARRIVALGYISRLEYNQFKDMYQCYKDMGGDGYADELKQQVEEINRLSIQSGMNA